VGIFGAQIQQPAVLLRPEPHAAVRVALHVEAEEEPSRDDQFLLPNRLAAVEQDRERERATA